MKEFFESLRDDTIKTNSFEKKKNEQKEPFENAKMCYIWKEKCEDRNGKGKRYCKVRDHCLCTVHYRGATHSICNLKHSIPKEIPIIFHNGSNYDYHCIIKELAEDFEGQFICLGENTEKYITIQFQ